MFRDALQQLAPWLVTDIKSGAFYRAPTEAAALSYAKSRGWSDYTVVNERDGNDRRT